MVGIGINEQNIGLVKKVGRSKLMFPPSYAAEAFIGMTPKRKIAEALKALDASQLGEQHTTIARWLEEKGEITWEDLEFRVREHSEGMAHILSSSQIKSRSRSAVNVEYVNVRRRGDARRGSERSRHTVIFLDDEKVDGYLCGCYQFRTGSKRGNLDGDDFITEVACYHVSAGLIDAGLMPYQFSGLDAALESLAMKVFRKTERKSFERDKFLLEQGIIPEEVSKAMSNGAYSLEVIWNRKNLDGRIWSIMRGMKSYLEQDSIGYHFDGFALDFPGMSYETTGIVMARDDGKSVHLLIDENLQVGRLPFVMLQIPLMRWQEHPQAQEVGELMGRNPVLYSLNGNRYFRSRDSRSGNDVVATIRQPVGSLLRIQDRTDYKTALSTAA